MRWFVRLACLALVAGALGCESSRGDNGGTDAGIATADGATGTDAGRPSGTDAGTLVRDDDAGPATDAGMGMMTEADAGPPVCGDGNVTSGEQCDDGNATPNDGCSPTCRFDANCDSPLDFAATATTGADGVATFRGSNGGGQLVATGSCAGDGSEVVIRYVPSMSGMFEVAMNGFDTVLHVRTTCGDVASEIACDDDGGMDTTSKLRMTVTGTSPLFIFADSYDEDEHGAFELTVRPIPTRAMGAACDTLRRTDLCAAGTVCAPGAGATAATCRATDLGCGMNVAVIDVTSLIDADDSVSYEGDTRYDMHHTSGSCSDDGDTSPETVHSLTMPFKGEVSVSVDGDPDIAYIRTTCTDTASETDCGYYVDGSDHGAYAAGTRLFIFVDGAPGTYTLNVSLSRTLSSGDACGDSPGHCDTGLICRYADPEAATGTCQPVVCGDGTAEGDEECDDHNTGAGDGCDASCHVEDSGMGGSTCGGEVALRLVNGPPDYYTGGAQLVAHATGTTVGAGSDLAGSCGMSEMSPEVVYSFTLTEAKWVDITVSTEDDYNIAAYLRGPGSCTGEEIECSEGFGESAYLYDMLEPGTYYVVIDGSEGSSGRYDLRLLANDGFGFEF